MDKSAVKLFNSPSMFNSETTCGKSLCEKQKVCRRLDKEPISRAGLPYRSVERLKKKVTLEQFEQLALEQPWNTEEEKKELLSLIVEYNDVDKAVLKFLECKNCWVE